MAEPSEDPRVDRILTINEEKIPLIYIDFGVEDEDKYAEIIQEKESIIFLFQNRKFMNDWNPKIISNIRGDSQLRESFRYSFNTLETLQSKGLKAVSTL